MTALLTALAGLCALAGARRGAEGDETISAAAELAELDRLKARGLLDEAGWTAARAEAGRRILVSDREAEPARAGTRDRLWVLGGLAVTAAAALGLYSVIGAPGLEDQAYERRVDQWTTELETLQPPQVAAVAARVARERPNDHEALTMLGAARFEAGDPIGAASAFRRALTLQPDDAQSWSRLGESLTRANGGVVGGDAEAAFAQALRRDPGQLGARYFLGEAALARNEAAMVRAMWGPLIAALDPADPRRADLQRRMPGETQ
ncbi:MAG: c-type cytochrome biogenesis protein CcmI [Brevundimonas sp.]|uniref:c-type cytochrome biogenesis protein CcmI n=1 Tax=Brevundimonas sp. TaxID=1871086 RepID=UPI002719FAFE|nr:c-type cytochrome biogenesis protein CcmI [Brevundimonas sp.]MDO9077632.1 c-type cytochrome biogenesis protein CcmI [Brevundimonas sp.]MDP3080905.1 c-type cytochrome biogenesis protein CcmI [Brevundimonas sp.]MDZ4062104.1 c-type cytochrome biogenesis protein CcmI [Brevundimonas sp.]